MLKKAIFRTPDQPTENADKRYQDISSLFLLSSLFLFSLKWHHKVHSVRGSTSVSEAVSLSVRTSGHFSPGLHTTGTERKTGTQGSVHAWQDLSQLTLVAAAPWSALDTTWTDSSPTFVIRSSHHACFMRNPRLPLGCLLP